jgi:16S rRNA (guanine(966)-N(2))-methyltransferase RsmD
MRVLAGEFKGRRLVTTRGGTTRPTGDRVRIACLDTLMPHLPRGPFLDLFAGSGAVGIEALSRGAPAAVFVELEAAALRALRDNIAGLGLEDRARVIREDAVRAVSTLHRKGERFAVVFLDPPYVSSRATEALDAVASRGVLTSSAVVVIQHATKTPPPETPGVLTLWKTSRFGETSLTFFRSPA